jgi:hypothetical protein
MTMKFEETKSKNYRNKKNKEQIVPSSFLELKQNETVFTENEEKLDIKNQTINYLLKNQKEILERVDKLESENKEIRNNLKLSDSRIKNLEKLVLKLKESKNSKNSFCKSMTRTTTTRPKNVSIIDLLKSLQVEIKKKDKKLASYKNFFTKQNN